MKEEGTRTPPPAPIEDIETGLEKPAFSITPNSLEQKLYEGAFSRATSPGYQEPAWVKEERKKAEAIQFGLPETATWEEIGTRRNNVAGQKAIEYRTSLGLPSDAATLQVTAAEREQIRIQRARELGLPDTTSPEEITQAFQQQKEDSRKREAESLGLSSDADWRTIHNAKQEVERKAIVKEYGLSADATWEDIATFFNNHME